MINAKRDENSVPTLLGVSSVDGVTPVVLYADPTTHRLLVDLPTGSGTVTSVSVVTANGVSGTVATATTTPAITLTLGAITPISVSATSFLLATPSTDTIAGVFRRNNAAQVANIVEIQSEVNAFLAGFDKVGKLTVPSVLVSGLTASEMVITDASSNLISAAVATYPSLTELSYVKGLTSAVQTQLNGKAATLSGTNNEIAYFNSGSTISSLTTATYPSLTELSYVKGVTSAIQTQLNAKGVGDMVLASVQSVTGLKTFDTTKLAVKGSSTGSTAIASANAGASDYTATLQASTGTIAYTSDVASKTSAIIYVIDGGGSAITTGSKGYLSIPAGYTITGWNLVADQSGSAVVDVKKCTYANFPTTATITSTDKPTLSAVQKNQNLAVSVWTTAITAGDILEFNVDSATTVTRLTLTIVATKT